MNHPIGSYAALVERIALVAKRLDIKLPQLAAMLEDPNRATFGTLEVWLDAILGRLDQLAEKPEEEAYRQRGILW